MYTVTLTTFDEEFAKAIRDEVLDTIDDVGITDTTVVYDITKTEEEYNGLVQ